MNLRFDLAVAASILTGESVEFELDVIDTIASIQPGGWRGIEMKAEELRLACGNRYLDAILSKHLTFNDG